MDIYTIVGLAGVVVYVAAYAALQLDMLDGNGVVYSIANVVAASLVLVSLTSDFNLASAAIQVIWITIGVLGLGLRFVRSRNQPVTLLASTEPPGRSGHSTLGLQSDQAPIVQAG